MEKGLAHNNRGRWDFMWYHQNCYIFEKNSAHDNRVNSIFKITLRKLPYFCEIRQLVIIGAVQIFKWHHQNCLIFAKILTLDNRGSLNFQMASLNLGYFCENFNLWLQGQLNFSSEFIRIVLFLWTLLIVITGPVHLFNWYHQESLIVL